MERYKILSSTIKDEPTGRMRIATTQYPEIPYRDTDIYIYSKRGQRLDLLAYQYYRDQSYWFLIAAANNLGKGKFNVPPGIRLRIPYPMDQLTLNEFLYSNEIL